MQFVFSVEDKKATLNNRYELHDIIGSGQSSVVHTALDKRNNAKVVIKVIKSEYLVSNLKNKKRVEDEMYAMSFLSHQSIVKMYEQSCNGVMLSPSGKIEGGICYIVMEHVKGLNMFDLVATINENEGLGEVVGRYFLTQILDALSYMHGQGIVHRDVKAENIMVDEQMNIRLIDFGFASYENNDDLSGHMGTPAYMAPEIKKGVNYKGTQVDIFSLAVVLFVIVRGIFPFKEAKDTNIWWRLLQTG